MAREKLQRLIASLNEELGSTEFVDDRSRELLQQLTNDIEKIAAGEPAESTTHATAASQLEGAALKFETDHPKLSMILGEIMDTLGKLGI
ncbi:MAG: DUF4404 family protein [Gammaproteobacteria bacterium]